MSATQNSMPVQEPEVSLSDKPRGRGSRRAGLSRALMYMPIILLMSALVAVATFPDLAELATPILDLAKPKIACKSNSLSSECMRQMMLNYASRPAMTSTESDESTTERSSYEQTEEPPADATLAVNAVEAETDSN